MNISLRDTALSNRAFRKVLIDGDHTEITVMKVTSEIPLEIHEDRDQTIYIVQGEVKVLIYNTKRRIIRKIIVKEDEAVFIPSYTYHRVVKTSAEPVKLFSVYSF